MANYILCGELTVNGDVLIKGTVYEANSLSSLVKKIGKDDYKDIMELTANKRTIDTLEVDDLVLVNFECEEKSILNVCGTSTIINTEVLE